MAVKTTRKLRGLVIYSYLKDNAVGVISVVRLKLILTSEK